MFNKKLAAVLAAAVFVTGGAAVLPYAGNSVVITASAEKIGDLSYEPVDGGYAIAAYYGNGGEVKIPSEQNGRKVVAIAESAFFQCDTVTAVTIPDTVTAIGDNAFMSCSSMKSVNIPDNVRTIGVCAFSNCSSLKSITLPNSLRTVGEAAFSDCTSLEVLTIPDKDIEFKYEAFLGCTALKNVTVPFSVKTIEEGAFGFTVSDEETAEHIKIDGFTLSCYMNSEAYIYSVEKQLNYNILDPDTPDIIYGIPDDADDIDDDTPKGDINADGKRNAVDITMTAGHIKGIKKLENNRVRRADINSDNKVNVADILLLAAHIKGMKTIS